MVAKKMLAGDTLKWMEHVEILPELKTRAARKQWKFGHPNERLPRAPKGKGKRKMRDEQTGDFQTPDTKQKMNGDGPWLHVQDQLNQLTESHQQLRQSVEQENSYSGGISGMGIHRMDTLLRQL
ncbi:unnamed protein product [Rhodiola kirilowii]